MLPIVDTNHAPPILNWPLPRISRSYLKYSRGPGEDDDKGFMSHTHPIVVGIDFSPASSGLIDLAARTASAWDVPLIVVHVVDTSRVSHWMAFRGSEDHLKAITAEGERKLDELVDAHRATAEVRTRVVSGRPAEVLKQVIDDEDAGLLVIAANDLTKQRLGSIASRCVRTAYCDVLVLRDWQERDFRKVVACIDLSAASERVISRAIDVAVHTTAKLEFVHVIYPPEKDLWGEAIAPDSSEGFTEHCRNEARAAMERALEPYAERLKDVDHRSILLESTVPSLALTFHIGDGGADLAVLGAHGHSNLGAYFLGTNAERMLTDAPVSVLAVRS